MWQKVMQQREQAARTFKGRHWRGSVLLLFPLCSKTSSGCVRCGVGRGALLLQNHKSFLLFLHLSKNIWKDSLFLFFIYWHKDESPKCYTGYKVKFISTGSKRSLHFLSVRGHDFYHHTRPLRSPQSCTYPHRGGLRAKSRKRADAFSPKWCSEGKHEEKKNGGTNTRGLPEVVIRQGGRPAAEAARTRIRSSSRLTEVTAKKKRERGGEVVEEEAPARKVRVSSPRSATGDRSGAQKS